MEGPVIVSGSGSRDRWPRDEANFVLTILIVGVHQRSCATFVGDPFRVVLGYRCAVDMIRQ